MADFNVEVKTLHGIVLNPAIPVTNVADEAAAIEKVKEDFPLFHRGVSVFTATAQ